MEKICICIPVYNYSVVPLLDAIHMELMHITQHKISSIVIDDGSSNREMAEQNKRCCLQYGTEYIENGENMGRSLTRNRFLMHTRAQYLLFLDADSLPVKDAFISTYLLHAQSDNPVNIFYGGTKYTDTPPERKYRLHWQYGRKREALTARARQQNPVTSFHSNNFMISRRLLQQYPFDESIPGYGHEDSLLAIQLHLAGYGITHIDNPVLHTGLSGNAEFIEKTKQAINNLAGADRRLSNEVLKKYNHLWRTYVRLKPAVSISAGKLLFAIKARPFEKLFLKGFYNDWLWAWYKLCYILSVRP